MVTIDELLRAARMEKEGIARRKLPLIAFYGRDQAFEDRRNAFYDGMAKKFHWPQRETVPSADAVNTASAPGRGGRSAQLELVGKKRSIPVIANAAPLEYMSHAGMLSSGRDGSGAAMLRFSAGMRLRGIFEGAEVSGMKSAAFDGGGGGSYSGRTVSDHKVDCMKILDHIRQEIPPRLFRLIEDMIYRDQWVWETAVNRDAVVREIQYGLDLVAVALTMAVGSDVRARWAKSRTDHGRDQGTL